MNITYVPRIKEIFDDDTSLMRVTNIELAKIIQRREREIRAFSNFLDFLNHGLGKPHSLEDSKGTKEQGLYAVSLTANYRLIIKPTCKNRSAESLKECNELIIVGVRDYHGKNEKWLVP
ncbi:MAG: hypothetical protein IJ220_01545 [Clostridia bacterium]|nr:hypothetical protein [Clostridia bacterium]